MGKWLISRKWLGILLALLSYSYIFYRIFQFRPEEGFFSSLGQPWYSWGLLLLIQIALLFFNIFFESKKWQTLIEPIFKVSIVESIQMVLAGFASGIFTPAKLGEPLGRLMNFDKKYWASGAVLNYLGGVVHNTIIVIIGLISLFLGLKNRAYAELSSLLNFFIIFLFIAIVATLLLWLKRLSIKSLFKKLSVFQNLNHIKSQIKQLSLASIVKIVGFSFFRYVIYSLQLLLMLCFMMGWELTDVGYQIPVYFLFISIVPSFILSDMGVRGSVALFLFSAYSLGEFSVLLAVFLVWLVNQVIPALLGSYFIVRTRA